MDVLCLEQVDVFKCEFESVTFYVSYNMPPVFNVYYLSSLDRNVCVADGVP